MEIFKIFPFLVGNIIGSEYLVDNMLLTISKLSSNDYTEFSYYDIIVTYYDDNFLLPDEKCDLNLKFDLMIVPVHYDEFLLNNKSIPRLNELVTYCSKL